MAAVVARVFCYEPCRAFGNCIKATCQCCSGLCDEIGKCCDSICYMFDRPFSCCLMFSIVLNAAALVYALLSLITGTPTLCGDPVVPFLIVIMVFSIFNTMFAFYIFRVMNSDEMLEYIDGSGRKKINENSEHQTLGNKAWNFFKFNPYFAAYIICIFIPMLVILILSAGYMCGNSTQASGLFWSSIILWIFIGIGFFILLSYVLVDALIEMAQNCWWWWIPCLWPCLLIGCCLKCAYDKYDENDYPRKHVNNTQAYAAQPTSNVNNTNVYGSSSAPSAPVNNGGGAVSSNYVQPVTVQPVQPVQVVVAQPVQPIPAQQQQQQQWQPHYTNQNPPNNYGQQQQQANINYNNNNINNNSNSDVNTPMNNNNNNNNNNNSNSNVAQPGQQRDGKEVAVEYAKKGGALAVQGGKKAFGFIAKGFKAGVHKLDQKLNDKPAAAAPAGNNEGKEGR